MKKSHIILFISLMLFVNLLVYLRFVLFPKSSQVIIAHELKTVSEPLTADSFVEADWVGTGDTMTSFSVFFSTYNRENTGTISLEILDGEQTIAQKHIELNELSDNSQYSFSDINVKMEKDKVYRARVYSEPLEGGVSVWFDGNGNLISSYQQLHKISPLEWFFVNVTYSITCCIIIAMHCWLKKEG